MAFCGNCGTQLNDGANFCPKCGNPCGSNAKPNMANSHYNKKLLFVFAFLLITIIIGCFWYFFKDDSSDYSLGALAKVLPNYEKVGDFHEGLAMVVNNGKVGVINKMGIEVVPCKYDEKYSYRDFSEGFAVVFKGAYCGYIDKSGKEITKLVYADANNFKEGMALVTKAGKKGFIDNTGKEVIPPSYDYAHDFSEGLAAVCKNDKWGYIDKSGKEVISLSYSGAGDYSEGLAAVSNGEKCGYIDKSGKIIIPFKFLSGEPFSEGIAQVYTNGNFYIDKTGDKISEEYWVTSPFKDGMAVVSRDSKFWLINRSGETLTIPGGIESLSEGLFLIYKDNGKYIADKNGKQMYSFKYDDAVYPHMFKEGYLIVQKGDGYGFIDTNGKELVPCVYEEASPFSDGLAVVKSGGVIGVINKEGESTYDYSSETIKTRIHEAEKEILAKQNKPVNEIKKEKKSQPVNESSTPNNEQLEREKNQKTLQYMSELQQIASEIDYAYNQYVSLVSSGSLDPMSHGNLEIKATQNIEKLSSQAESIWNKLIALARETGGDVRALQEEKKKYLGDAYRMQMSLHSVGMNTDY